MNIIYKLFSSFSLKKRLQLYYFFKFKNKLRLDEPKKLSEKIQKRKLNLHYEYSILSDKFLVREYVKKKIGDEYLIPLIDVLEDINDIDISRYPNSFVIKTNHGSGIEHIEIVKDKHVINLDKIKEKFKKALESNYKGSLLGETQYDKIDRKIVIEKFMDNNGDDIDDFKFHMFNGNDGFLQIDFDRFKNHKRNLYSFDAEMIDASLCYPNGIYDIKKNIIKEMLDVAKKLSSEFNYVRVDLYYINERVYFGEMTFTPGSGFESFSPSEFDEKFGSLWNEIDGIY